MRVFFSSRRRHTRWTGDWSSDVCSSDLKSEAFYIGALGSRTTHSKRLERLRANGFGDAELQRIRGPIGLDIGARSPAEIRSEERRVGKECRSRWTQVR